MSEKRGLFAWIIFLVIYLVLVGGIAYAGMAVYGARLGAWVAASALIAGCVSMYLFHEEVPGETFMKVVLGLTVALNAGYLVHNGARAAGVDAFNSAQVKKFEVGMAAAARAGTRAVAKQLGVSVKDATELQRSFGGDVAIVAALLAFLELASAIVIFAIASRRQPGKAAEQPAETRQTKPIKRAYINGADPEGDRPN